MDCLTDVKIIPLKTFPTNGGEVMHGIKKTDIGLSSFGEAYFTSIEKNIIRGWKLHKLMVCNLIVPIGNIKFVLYDNRIESKTFKKFQQITLGKNNYCKLIMPNNIWFAFQGISSKNLIFNFSNIIHEPSEVNKKDLEDLMYDWN